MDNLTSQNSRLVEKTQKNNSLPKSEFDLDLEELYQPESSVNWDSINTNVLEPLYELEFD